MVRPLTSMMFRPQTVTARASGLRRRPAQEGHGRRAMYRSSSPRMYSDSVSRKRRVMFRMTPSKGVCHV